MKYCVQILAYKGAVHYCKCDVTISELTQIGAVTWQFVIIFADTVFESISATVTASGRYSNVQLLYTPKFVHNISYLWWRITSFILYTYMLWYLKSLWHKFWAKSIGNHVCTSGYNVASILEVRQSIIHAAHYQIQICHMPDHSSSSSSHPLDSPLDQK